MLRRGAGELPGRHCPGHTEELPVVCVLEGFVGLEELAKDWETALKPSSGPKGHQFLNLSVGDVAVHLFKSRNCSLVKPSG